MCLVAVGVVGGDVTPRNVDCARVRYVCKMNGVLRCGFTGEDALFPGAFLSACEAGVPGSFGGALCEVPAEACFLGVDCPRISR